MSLPFCVREVGIPTPLPYKGRGRGGVFMTERIASNAMELSASRCCLNSSKGKAKKKAAPSKSRLHIFPRECVWRRFLMPRMIDGSSRFQNACNGSNLLGISVAVFAERAVNLLRTSFGEYLVRIVHVNS